MRALPAFATLCLAMAPAHAGHRAGGPAFSTPLVLEARIVTRQPTAVFATADSFAVIATQPANRLGTVLGLQVGRRVAVDFADGPDGWVDAGLLAGPYVPPAETSGGWRALVGRNQVATTSQKASVRQLAELDWDRLKRAHDYSRSFDSAASLLVIRNGYVAGEWGGATAAPVASISKSLAGLALARVFELAASGSSTPAFLPHAAIQPFLPPSWSAGQPEKAAVSIADLMTMTSGLQADDRPTVPDYYSVLLALPASTEPRAEWAYSSAAVDLLSIGVQRASGGSLRQLFDQHIGSPIGLPPLSWGTELAGHTVASSRARIAPRDLARVGYLMMLEGAWPAPASAPRVLRRESVARLLRGNPCGTAAAFVPTSGSPFPLRSTSDQAFGHLWWLQRGHRPLGPDVPGDAFYAHGLGEKLLVVVPSLNLVVVRHGSQPAALSTFAPGLMSLVMASVIQPPSSTALPWIDSFTLVERGSGLPVHLCNPLPDGAEIDAALTPLAQIEVRATLRDGTPGSVRFVIGDDLAIAIDSAPPFAFDMGNLVATLAPGIHELAATIHAEPNGTGAPGATARLRFMVGGGPAS